MTTKRLFVSAGVFTACVILALCVLATLAFRDGVTRANYDRIEEGMTLTEVQEVFGKAGAVFHGYPNRTELAYCWENADRSFAILFFDSDSMVVENAKWADSTESIGDKIRRWLFWPWWK